MKRKSRKRSRINLNNKFIVIDGTDFTGKSTQVGLLSKSLRLCGKKNIITHEPQRGEPIGNLIYQYLKKTPADPYSMALLYSADRNEHTNRVIQPALSRGDSVITDRYHITTVAYQGVHCNMDELWNLGKNFIEPDITIIIDGDPERLIKRAHSVINGYTIGQREPDVFEIDLEFQKKVRKNYLKIAKDRDYYIVDGENSVEMVHIHLLSLVNKSWQ
jgi:dTMP kinase